MDFEGIRSVGAGVQTGEKHVDGLWEEFALHCEFGDGETLHSDLTQGRVSGHKPANVVGVSVESEQPDIFERML